jgi:hypothetical protein
MASERRGKFLLAGLIVALVGVMVWTWRSQSSVPSTSSNGTAGQTGAARRPKSSAAGAPDVHLKALGAEHAKPMEVVRNLFRFKPKPLPPPPAPPRLAIPQAPDAAPPPVLTPQTPPIALKFIGLVQTADKTQRLAVLSDGRGSIPIYGKEGDIIDGRYRIVRIGAESIELAYLDGRGRQTIRLSGG